MIRKTGWRQAFGEGEVAVTIGDTQIRKNVTVGMVYFDVRYLKG